MEPKLQRIMLPTAMVLKNVLAGPSRATLANKNAKLLHSVGGNASKPPNQNQMAYADVAAVMV